MRAKALCLVLFLAAISVSPQPAWSECAPRQRSLCIPWDTDEIRMVFGGDVLLDLIPGERILTHGIRYPFEGIALLTQNAHIAFCNLECAASSGGEPLPNKPYTFRARPEHLDALTWAGFNVVSVANNHTLDFGVDAFLDTLAHLEDRGIVASGGGANAKEAYTAKVVAVNGVKIGFLSFTDTFAIPKRYHHMWGLNVALTTDENRVAEACKAAARQVDFLIVSMHFGYEYLPEVVAEQRRLARLAVDSGAGLVVGHHPHIPQGVEVYKNAPILYSLGNLVFHPYDRRAENALLATFSLRPNLSWSLALHPVKIQDGRVRLMDPGEADTFLEHVSTLSKELDTEVSRVADSIRVQP
ncbi:MAG: CapA family protein [Bacillota bacterium]